MKFETERSILWSFVTFLALVGHPLAWAVQGVVTNKEGRSFEGTMRLNRQGTALLVEVQADQGLVSYSFNKDALAGIAFLDAEAVEDGLDAFERGQFEAAISHLETVHRSRSPFFKMIPAKALVEPSLALGNAYLKVQRYADAMGVAGVLLNSDVSDSAILSQATDMRLLAFFGLQRWDETEVLANRWCADHEPADESALGWWILAEVHLAREEYTQARWISLQPITFSSQFPKAYLQHCFHVAIASWLDEDPEEAWKLYKDYRDRGFVWPDDRHPKVKLTMINLAPSAETEAGDTEEAPTLEEGLPKRDLNLPLETVKKLTTKLETSQTP